MGFFDRFRAKRQSPERASKVRMQGVDVAKIQSPEELDAFMRGTASGSGRISEADSLKSAAVYRCVRLLAGVAAGLPVEIKTTATNAKHPDHPVVRLLNRRPNRFMHARAFKAMMLESVLLRGNGYALKVRTGERLTSLIPLSAYATSCEQLRDGTLLYKHTDKFGGYREFTQDEIFHLRGMTIDGITGMSVLQHARETIGFALSAQKHGKNLFDRGAKVSGIYQHPEQLSDAAYQRLKDSIAEYEGVDGDRSGGTQILEEGMEYKPITMTSADAEFVENKKLGITEICMFFGVPPHLIGFTEKQTSYGSGVESQNISFIDHGIGPWLDEWEGAIDRDLLTNELSKHSELNTYKLQRGDQKTRWEANRIKLEMGTHSPNEIRRLEGEPEREGGDVYYDPPNVPQTGEQNVTGRPDDA